MKLARMAASLLLSLSCVSQKTALTSTLRPATYKE
jgi:hypothetical protein